MKTMKICVFSIQSYKHLLVSHFFRFSISIFFALVILFKNDVFIFIAINCKILLSYQHKADSKTLYAPRMSIQRVENHAKAIFASHFHEMSRKKNE